MKRPCTLYLDSAQYEELRRVCAGLGISVSSKIDELIHRCLQEITGKTEDSVNPADYEALKNQYNKFVIKTDKFEKQFKSRGTFNDLYDFSEAVGLDLSELSDLPKFIPILLEKWTGEGDMHQWITFLELVKERREVEARLEAIRVAMGKPADFEADASPSGIQASLPASVQAEETGGEEEEHDQPEEFKNRRIAAGRPRISSEDEEEYDEEEELEDDFEEEED